MSLLCKFFLKSEDCKEYIESDKIKELKAIYRTFKNGIYIKTDEAPENNKKQSYDYDFAKSFSGEIVHDAPITAPDYKEVDGKLIFPRNPAIAERALANAKYVCEASCNTILFTKKNSNHLFTEAHHLIPLSFQPYFNVSLDVEANIVSLCPNCHSLLHYGEKNEFLLKRLYDMRKERLSKCGISISFEELLLLYR